MSWELAASLGDEAVDDVAWTTTASGHDEYIASAQGSAVIVWQLEGHANNLQVWKPLHNHYSFRHVSP